MDEIIMETAIDGWDSFRTPSGMDEIYKKYYWMDGMAIINSFDGLDVQVAQAIWLI